MTERFVIYRSGTIGGALAAWAFHLVHSKSTTVFMSHNASPSHRIGLVIPRSCEIYFIECSPPDAETLRKYCLSVRQVHIWDHHPRTKALVEQFVTHDAVTSKTVSTLPLNASFKAAPFRTGCMTVCHELGIQLTARQRALFARVQDHELGIHLYPHSYGFAAALASKNIDYRIEANPWLFSQLSSLDPDALEREAIELQQNVAQSVTMLSSVPSPPLPLPLTLPKSPTAGSGEEKSDALSASSGALKIIIF